MRRLPNFAPTHQNSQGVSLPDPAKRFRCLHHKLDHARVGLLTFIRFLVLMAPRCDEISLDGNRKPAGVVRSKYTHAQKMRASMTHVFGRDFGLGSERWQKSEWTGRMAGNPSVSTQLASYMVSLRNRKVCGIFSATATPENLNFICIGSC